MQHATFDELVRNIRGRFDTIFAYGGVLPPSLALISSLMLASTMLSPPAIAEAYQLTDRGKSSMSPDAMADDLKLVEPTGRAVSFDFAAINVPIAGVAAGERVAFVGEPLNGTVIALSLISGKQIGALPPPSPTGFALPFIMHSIGRDRVAVLDAGGLPQPNPFVPVSPTIYEYSYSYSFEKGFSATLVGAISFAGVPFGFPEDFVRLKDGRYLISDSILGSIWVAQPDGTITPGIVPKSFNLQDLIPTLAFCPTMPEVTVNGYPFLFTGSTLPGVSPLAVRNGTVYYYSPCARGIYAFPLSILDDNQPPDQRAADIYLVAPTPGNIEVEELLDFSFNPYNDHDPFLYAAQPLQLQVIRIDVRTGAREAIASGRRLFDFPSALAFVPSTEGAKLIVVSNQQERSPLTNDAVTQTTFNLPFIVAKVLINP